MTEVTTDIAVRELSPAPVSAIADRYRAIREAVQSLMNEGVDYGKVPGGSRPTLLKPGAEKLATLFRLRPVLARIQSEEDWTGERHSGEPFFLYVYRCTLMRDGEVYAEALGSCNSWETKYRYRWVMENGRRKRVKNENIYDVVNTVDKIAQKRAFVGAVLLACGASDYFTQDLEDLPAEVIAEVDEADNEPRTERTVDVEAAGYTQEIVRLLTAAGMKPLGVNAYVKGLIGKPLTDLTADEARRCLEAVKKQFVEEGAKVVKKQQEKPEPEKQESPAPAIGQALERRRPSDYTTEEVDDLRATLHEALSYKMSEQQIDSWCKARFGVTLAGMTGPMLEEAIGYV